MKDNNCGIKCAHGIQMGLECRKCKAILPKKVYEEETKMFALEKEKSRQNNPSGVKDKDTEIN